MIIVTGGAGFIGSQMVKALNAKGIDKILVVDDLSNGHKFRNIADLDILDFLDKDDFRMLVSENFDFDAEVEAVFHLGACTDTTEWNGQMMMQNNYEYSKLLFHYCIENKIQFIYASSASVYGFGENGFKENRRSECPINVYGYSKWQFDQYVRHHVGHKNHCQVVGLRYFNVYGPREWHKEKMASVVHHFNQQLLEDGEVRLFEGTAGFGNGEQRRDFVYVEDVVAVNLWFYEHAHLSGIFNVGTGKSQTFNEIAQAVIDWHGFGNIRYIPFPEELKSSYQHFTEASLEQLRNIGYDGTFRTVQEGVNAYLNEIHHR